MQPRSTVVSPVYVSSSPSVELGWMETHTRFGDVGLVALVSKPVYHVVEVTWAAGGMILVAVVGHYSPLHEDVWCKVSRQEGAAAQYSPTLPAFCRVHQQLLSFTCYIELAKRLKVTYS